MISFKFLTKHSSYVRLSLIFILLGNRVLSLIFKRQSATKIQKIKHLQRNVRKNRVGPLLRRLGVCKITKERTINGHF